MDLKQAAAELVADYRRMPSVQAVEFTRGSAYRHFIEAAEQAGFTGPDIEIDSEFSDRSRGWVARADEQQLRRWIHTLIRSDRWNGDYPDAVLAACRSGGLSGLIGPSADTYSLHQCERPLSTLFGRLVRSYIGALLN